ncbi:hypothetical protein FA15DRAFT_659828 [Coprinopsis marcescibilis]|uniref:Uncharacterized protein n=1 Tax=Coprinopsis marcescibilis TaxID=230819 RepID=A0A5C3KHZ8_COPMA|nr:hypothetical protein FA15DRAFT_659828 [Coprinopsis marcescibilis]
MYSPETRQSILGVIASCSGATDLIYNSSVVDKPLVHSTAAASVAHNALANAYMHQVGAIGNPLAHKVLAEQKHCSEQAKNLDINICIDGSIWFYKVYARPRQSGLEPQTYTLNSANAEYKCPECIVKRTYKNQRPLLRQYEHKLPYHGATERLGGLDKKPSTGAIWDSTPDGNIQPSHQN